MTNTKKWVLRLAVMPLNIALLVAIAWYIFTREPRVFPAFLLWLAFSIYWGISARNSAPSKTSESKASSVFHQIVLNIAIILLFAPLPGLRGWFLPQRLSLAVAGVLAQVGFIVLAIWARRHLGRNWSSAVRIGEGHALVRSGPYRLLRHPIYTAMLGMFLGTALASGQYHALLGFALLLVAYLRKTRMEEQILRETFGAEYDTYRQHTWALVPLVF